ncbi:HIT domain-containing protein, partial [Candidatus Pacearchaeota archaeon]|nr:HIT domain-containing protein [Candidatus Pacearchaeota archaeon]MBD3283284.1 HIT domain-containing protein [Candidatus Pacearchaeota archaeon]
ENTGDRKCVFCDYELKDRIIKESENTLTILSDPYLLKGHCLVIPKKHFESILEVPEEVLFELVKEVRAVERFLIEKFKISGCDIRQHYRPFQKQSNLKVNHLHFHVIPREFEDELYEKSMIFEKDVFKKLDENTVNQFREVLG